MSRSANIRRRDALGALSGMALVCAFPLVGSASADDDLPGGALRGRRVGVQDGLPIYEVRGRDGRLVGYALSARNMAAVRVSAHELEARAPSLTPRDFPRQYFGIDILDTAKCAAAITWFAAQTVFPSAKLARVAAKLLGMVKKYGVKKVAAALTRWRKSKDRDMEADLKDLALALSGVGALSACVG